MMAITCFGAGARHAARTPGQSAARATGRTPRACRRRGRRRSSRAPPAAGRSSVRSGDCASARSGPDVDRHAERREPRGRSPRRARRGAARWRARNAASAACRRVEEVAEHVHVAAGVDRGDLDAADRLDAARAAPARAPRATDAVVSWSVTAITRSPAPRRASTSSARSQPAVGRGGVEVEVDHRAARAAAEP